MSQYEKPKMTILTLTGNEQLCGSCADKNAILLGANPTSGLAVIFDMIVGDNQSPLTRDELANAFGPGEACKKTIESYCKFNGTTTVAWS